MLVVSVLLLLSTPVYAGAQGPQPKPPRANKHKGGVWDEHEWVGIGVVNPRDIGAVHRALGRVGIESIVDGSVVYGIRVRRADRTKAIETLRKDSRRKGYWIKLNQPDRAKHSEMKPDRLIRVIEAMPTMQELLHCTYNGRDWLKLQHAMLTLGLKAASVSDASLRAAEKIIRGRCDSRTAEFRAYLRHLGAKVGAKNATEKLEKRATADIERCHLVNRLAFDVSNARLRPRVYTWIYSYPNDGTVVHQWPLSIDSGGIVRVLNPKVFQRPIHTTGPPPDILEEFDFLKATFGRRRGKLKAPGRSVAQIRRR